jgi:hypothetical protein
MSPSINNTKMHTIPIKNIRRSMAITYHEKSSIPQKYQSTQTLFFSQLRITK